ncbi:N,N'-diacetylchitobiose transport system permease protein [Nakamurella sp. UYEF19]|uniref:carbohydrate ABC transporter permease n=1 Tax=Nakamurella sp. UYEF19 TaxID=1756392 RepID=UPI0033909DD9
MSIAPPITPASPEATPAPVHRPRTLAPYAMVAPLVVVLLLVLLVPLMRLVVVSLQTYGLDQLIGGRPATFVGLSHYGEVLSSSDFWSALRRTVLFVAVAVGLTVGLGLALAHLLAKVSGPVRVFLLLSLVTVWAMPPIIAMPIWRWLIDQRFGVLNYALNKVGVLPTRNFNWFREPLTGWTVITAIVVWGALPFVVISLHAALVSVSTDHLEAARLDGAGAWKVFTAVTLPAIRSTLLIITTLSIIWDYRVFAQIWLLRDIGANKDAYYTIGIWSYVESFSNKNFGFGAAISLVSVVLLGGLSVFAVRHVLASTAEEGSR